MQVKENDFNLIKIHFLYLGQEIYKEFDYFIRFLHHRVLKVSRER